MGIGKSGIFLLINPVHFYYFWTSVQQFVQGRAFAAFTVVQKKGLWQGMPTISPNPPFYKTANREKIPALLPIWSPSCFLSTNCSTENEMLMTLMIQRLAWSFHMSCCFSL